MDKVKLIKSLIKKLDRIPQFDFVDANGFKDHAEMVITNVFGPESIYLPKIRSIHFFSISSGMESQQTIYDRKIRAWTDAVRESSNLIDTMLDDLEIAGSVDDSKLETEKVKLRSIKIFIVHGRDNEMKSEVARVIEKLDFEPVILHEQPNKGRTIIEKFTDYSKVGFAVVLLSPDDVGGLRKKSPYKLKHRARQNVILELGFFLGKLGREHVFPLYRKMKGKEFELPSDYDGVIFTKYDKKGAWKNELVRELKESGYEADANKII